MLDVGANIGWFSLLAKAHGASKVYSFEPNLQNMIRFCESLHLNKWLGGDDNHDHRGGADVNTAQQQRTKKETVIPIPKGASNHTGSLKFFDNGGNNPGMATFAASGGIVLGELHVITLDSFAEQHGWFESKPTIALFKLDVEQYEFRSFKRSTKVNIFKAD